MTTLTTKDHTEIYFKDDDPATPVDTLDLDDAIHFGPSTSGEEVARFVLRS